jgi:hypothetical protein
MSSISQTGRYVIRSFFNGQQMNNPEWGWDDKSAACIYAQQLAKDNGDPNCMWEVWDRKLDRFVIQVTA